MKRLLALSAILVLVLGAVHAASGSNASTVVSGNLTSGPYSDASVVAPVPTGTAVSVIERQGGWYHVRLASGQDGWLPMTSIKYDGGSAGTSSSSTNWSSLFESGRAGAGGTTASTGVRGLNTGDIANAVPDPKAVAQLDKWAVKPPEAKQFARELPLKEATAGYLPEPKP
ncbi:MAG: SH3 domain-containing protein [Bacillota bacterium]